MNTNDNSSTTSQWLTKATARLAEVGLPTARLDCLVLLEDASGKDRAWLLAHPAFGVGDTTDLDKLVERRAQHEPLAYIRGRTEFYGREFIVNAHTLEPRPETETMIELVKSLVKSRESLVIADIGTGSGCIAISVKLEIPNAKVFATDIDVKCLEAARENSKKLIAEIMFFEGNLLNPINKNVDIILSNLPYVPAKYELNKAAKYEPRHAIFGGEDGLDLYRELFAQLKIQSSKFKVQNVLTESLPFQHEVLADIAKTAGYTLGEADDFIQVFSLNS